VLVDLDPVTGVPSSTMVPVAAPWDLSAIGPSLPGDLAQAADSSAGLVLLGPPRFPLILQPDVDASGMLVAPPGSALDFGAATDSAGDLTLHDSMPRVIVHSAHHEESEAIRHAADAVNAFETALGGRRLPSGFTPDALHASSTEIARYRTYIDEHRDFRLQLAEIEVKERTARVLQAEARRALGRDFDPDGWNGSWFTIVERRYRALVDERKVVRTLLYRSELGEHERATEQAALDYFARVFDVRGSPLSPEEELALERDHDESLRKGPVSIGDRLELIEELRVPTSPSETLVSLGLYRTRAGEEGLVGVTSNLSGAFRDLVEVIALDAAAETLLGGRTPHIIARTSFHPLTFDQLNDRLAQTRTP